MQGWTQGPKKEGGRLSNVALTHKETNILHLGLKCGLKRPISKFDVFVDVHKYMRKLNIKKYFLNKNANLVGISGSTSVAVDRGLHNKLLFNPPNMVNQHLEMYKELVLRDLDHITPKKNVNPRHIQEGIEMLDKRKNIILLSKDFYHNQLTEMLSDGETYTKFDRDPTSQYREELETLVEPGYQTGFYLIKRGNTWFPVVAVYLR